MSRDIGDLSLRVTSRLGVESLTVEIGAGRCLDDGSARKDLDRGEVELLAEACHDYLNGRAI